MMHNSTPLVVVGASEHACHRTLSSFPQTNLVVIVQEVLEVDDIHDALLFGGGAGVPGAVRPGSRLAAL